MQQAAGACGFLSLGLWMKIVRSWADLATVGSTYSHTGHYAVQLTLLLYEYMPLTVCGVGDDDDGLQRARLLPRPACHPGVWCRPINHSVLVGGPVHPFFNGLEPVVSRQ